MKNHFLKKVIFSVLILTVIVFLSGCTQQQQIIPPIPSTYTIRVISGCQGCFGNVVVNGVPSGAYLPPWGGANISGVPSGAAIRLEDEFGFVSHTEFFNPVLGTNIVFNWF